MSLGERQIGADAILMSKLTGRKPRFFKGDIVYGYLRPYLNKVWVAEFDGLCSVDQFVHSVNSSLADTEYVALFMRSPLYLKTAPVAETPGQLPRIRTEEVAEVPIYLPALTEQRRITARLKDELAEVARARAAVETQLKAAQLLPAALLRDVFQSNDAENWPEYRLGDVCKVQSGYAFKSDWFSLEGIRLLRNINISQGSICWEETARIPHSRRGDFNEYELKVGDIVISLDRPVVSGGLKLARLTDQDVPTLLLQRSCSF